MKRELIQDHLYTAVFVCVYECLCLALAVCVCVIVELIASYSA